MMGVLDTKNTFTLSLSNIALERFSLIYCYFLSTKLCIVYFVGWNLEEKCKNVLMRELHSSIILKTRSFAIRFPGVEKANIVIIRNSIHKKHREVMRFMVHAKQRRLICRRNDVTSTNFHTSVPTRTHLYTTDRIRRIQE